MPYPPAPWMLCGQAFQSLRWIPTRRARQFVPAPFQIVAFLPGRTLGGLYLASYGEGSTLLYHELIVVAAVVRLGWRAGIWISHIYVDSEASLEGGREIWGLPKQRARFEREADAIAVSQEGRMLCTLHYQSRPLGIPGWFPLPAFGLSDSHPLFFLSQVRARVRPMRARWDVPLESPFAALGLAGTGLGFHATDLRAIIAAPRLLARKR